MRFRRRREPEELPVVRLSRFEIRYELDHGSGQRQHVTASCHVDPAFKIQELEAARLRDGVITYWADNKIITFPARDVRTLTMTPKPEADHG